MSFQDFQHLARLHAVSALELEELTEFQRGLECFGELAEEYVHDCHRLETALALSLPRAEPRPEAKARMLAVIQKGSGRN